jgi:hypothetical protein
VQAAGGDPARRLGSGLGRGGRTPRRRVKPVRARLVLVQATCLAVGGCELQEITIAEPEPLVVAEIVLRAGESRQTALLHRSLGGPASAGVPDAVVEIRDGAGRALRLLPAPDTVCLLPDDTLSTGRATCYSALAGSDFVRAGERYTLRLDLADGRTLTAATRVPGDFVLVRPAVHPCRLAADVTLDLEWTASAGAWVYLAETSLRGIAAALGRRGVSVGQDPLRLVGLAISARDTTIAFPAEFGIFDRFDPDLADALLALRGGLPPDVTADLVVAAADRNYVNWIRGGSFNPSGAVRIPSIRGDGGTGVFGSIVARPAQLTTRPLPPRPPCVNPRS